MWIGGSKKWKEHEGKTRKMWQTKVIWVCVWACNFMRIHPGRAFCSTCWERWGGLPWWLLNCPPKYSHVPLTPSRSAISAACDGVLPIACRAARQCQMIDQGHCEGWSCTPLIDAHYVSSEWPHTLGDQHLLLLYAVTHIHTHERRGDIYSWCRAQMRSCMTVSAPTGRKLPW